MLQCCRFIFHGFSDVIYSGGNRGLSPRACFFDTVACTYQTCLTRPCLSRPRFIARIVAVVF